MYNSPQAVSNANLQHRGDSRGARESAAERELRIAVVAPYRVVPPASGGQAQIANGCRELARRVAAVRCFALRTLRERGPVAHAGFDYTERTAWCSALVALSRFGLTKVPFWAAQGGWARRLARDILAMRADVVEVHMPWLMTLRAALPRHIPVVLHAQNVEALWYADALAASPVGGIMKRWLERLEGRAVRAADRIAVLTERDGAELCRRYGAAPGRVWVLPPGCDPAPDPARAGKTADPRVTALFVGSRFSGNVAAARALCRVVAPAVADHARIVIAGGVCDVLRDEPPAPNVELAGYVPDLDPLLRQADVFLNPSDMNTGINAKVLDALSYGIPVLATPEGARGYERFVGSCIRVAPVEEFARALRAVAPPTPAAVREARDHHAWPRVIGERLERYRDLVAALRTERAA